MSTDISSKVQEITITNSVDDSEAGGTVVLAGTDYVDAGTIAIDKQFYVSLEYSPAASALNLRGVVSDIDTKDTLSGDKETVVTLMSPFKNYRKQVLHTTYFPTPTTVKSVLDLLAGTYMGLPAGAYDFTNVLGSLNIFRIDGLTIPQAMSLLAGTENKEICWYQGKLRAKGLGPGFTYAKSRCSVFQLASKDDLKIVNTVNVTGAEMTPDTAPVAETIGTLAIPVGELTEGVDRRYFYVELTKLPAINITVTSDLTTYFDFSYEGLKGNYAVILATRSGGGSQGATNLTVKGRPYKLGKLKRKVPRTVAIPGYNDIDTEMDYENPFIQNFTDADTVGQYQLVFNKYAITSYMVVAPHNPELEPNSTLEITDGGVTLNTLIVRKITTTWRASDSISEDTIIGWNF